MLTLPYNIVCGYFDCQSEFGNLNVSPKRKTTKFEIEFYLEDGLSTFADNNEYKIKKHYIQIAKPNQVRYSQLPFKTMYLKFSVDGDIAEKLKAAPEYFRSSHPEKIAEILDEIILLNENKNNDDVFAAFESEFARTLSPSEYEYINSFLTLGFSEELK